MSDQRFTTTVNKALVRYREETVRAKLIDDAVAALDRAGGDALTPRETNTDAQVHGAVDVAAPLWYDSDVSPIRQASGSAQPLQPLTPLAVSQVEPHLRHMPLEREALRRKTFRWLLIFTILPLAGWIATRPVDMEKELTAVLISYGHKAVVSSPVDGTVHRVLELDDGVVTQGQVLMQIKPDVSPELLSAQREWVSSRIREYGIKARLGGESEIVYPTELANAFSNIDVGQLLERERERLRDGEREAAEILAAAQRSIDAELADLNDIRGKKLAMDDRLIEVRRRLQRTEALLSQNVVFENGIYTEQSVKKLRARERGITGKYTELNGQEEQIKERLDELKATLSEREQAYRSRLRNQLEESRAAADLALKKVEGIKVQSALVDLNASQGGYFQAASAFEPGSHVARGDTIGWLRVPGDKGMVESPLESHEAHQVQLGQAATVTLLDLEDNTELQFDGRVASILSDTVQGAGSVNSESLRIEIHVPQQAGPVFNLAQGMSGRVQITTRGEVFWQWGWRTLGDLVQTWWDATGKQTSPPAPDPKATFAGGDQKVTPLSPGSVMDEDAGRL